MGNLCNQAPSTEFEAVATDPEMAKEMRKSHLASTVAQDGPVKEYD